MYISDSQSEPTSRSSEVSSPRQHRPQFGRFLRERGYIILIQFQTPLSRIDVLTAELRLQSEVAQRLKGGPNQDLASWNRLSKLAAPSSTEVAAADMVLDLPSNLQEISPEHFRFAANVEQATGDGPGRVGAVIERVGPAAYDAWTETDEYRQWRARGGQP